MTNLSVLQTAMRAFGVIFCLGLPAVSNLAERVAVEPIPRGI